MGFADSPPQPDTIVGVIKVTAELDTLNEEDRR